MNETKLIFEKSSSQIKKLTCYKKKFTDIKELCEHMWNYPDMFCQCCPFHVQRPDHCECYFEYIGGKIPKEWDENDLGCLV